MKCVHVISFLEKIMRSLQTSSVQKNLPGFPTKFRWFFSLSVSFFLFLGFVFWNPILMAQEPADARFNQVEGGRFLQRGGLEKYPPEKLEKIRRLRKALHKGDLDGPFVFFLVAAHLRSLDASRKGQVPPPPEVPDRSFFPLTEGESRSYEQAVQNHERNGLVTLACAYEDAADGDLEKYLDFLERGAGKNWLEASFQSNLQGIKAAAEIMWKLAWKVAARSR